MPSEPQQPDAKPKSPGWWLTAVVVLVGVIYLGVSGIGVQPYLPPAGHGAIVAGELTSNLGGTAGVLATRPPAVTPESADREGTVVRVVAGSGAAAAGISVGDRLVPSGTPVPANNVDDRLRAWRDSYWIGVSGPVNLAVLDSGGHTRAVQLERPGVWALSSEVVSEWLALRAGLLMQMALFILCAGVILLLRPRFATAQFAIVALVLCGISSGGPLGGWAALGRLPAIVLTLAAWLSMPLAFPAIGLAVAYFPRRSPLLERHPALHALPFVIALPMLVTSTLTALFICGVDGLLPAARWDAEHPAVFLGDFAVGLLFNIAVVSEAVYRFRGLTDPNDRRKISLAIGSTVVGVVAYVMQAGAPAVSALVTGRGFGWPWWISLPLYILGALPALGLTYAVVVHRVLSPGNVLRQSLQYALARKTLGVAAVLPALLLIVSLVSKRHESLAEIVTGQPLVDAMLLAGVLLAFRFRDRAMAWLDRRFFRAAYDAREILLSLAGRVPYETDPRELTSLVLHQIDQALHPSTAAVLASGLEAGVLTPISVLHGRVEPLTQNGPLATLLAWSDQPLDLDLNDTRSPARRLPPEETAWVSGSGAALLVPLMSRERDTPTLVGVIVLGEKRSEEPYTAEDRTLLSSIAGQVSLGLDVARLRRRETPADAVTVVAPASSAESPVAECPTCQACHDPGTLVCATDGTPLRAGVVPRTIDSKYRVDRVLGTGGMGAVYLAHDMRLDRDVAIKVVRSDLIANPDARARFRREAQLIARLQHPGIVSVFDYGTVSGGAAFLVMEYVRGRDLRSVVSDGPQAPALVARLLASIAEPIDAAHRLGILHRDLKPENILLPENGIVTAKVLDFGIAKAVASPDTDQTGGIVTTLTAVGQPIGTPAYMAPEQLAGGAVSERTDVYALGVIGYELLTGELPYGRGSFIDIALRQVSPAPLVTRQDVPDGLKQLIAEALSPEPMMRPSSARDFADRVRSAA